MHSTLIFMRKIWAKIVINNISLNQVNKALTDNDIRINIIDDIDIDISERKNLRIDLYWKLLIEYHYKDAGIPIIRSQNIHDWVFQPDGLAFLDDEQAESQIGRAHV